MYCRSGPAIGPAGRGHLHQVHCDTGLPLQRGVPSHTHAVGQAPEFSSNGLIFVGLVAAAAFFLWRSEKRAARKRNPGRRRNYDLERQGSGEMRVTKMTRGRKYYYKPLRGRYMSIGLKEYWVDTEGRARRT